MKGMTTMEERLDRWHCPITVLCAVVGFALACSACRSKNESSPPVQNEPPAPSAATVSSVPLSGVTDTEIVLGESAAFSGPSAGLGIEMWRGASAAFAAANDHGGVLGRKVRLVLADDAYDAERAAPAVVSLVQQEHVFLLFGAVGTPTLVRALPVIRKYYGESGLFLFSDFTGAQPQRRPPYDQVVFNVRASYYEEAKAIVDAYVSRGKKRIGTFVQDDAYGTDGREGVKRALKDQSLSLVADTTYPRGQKVDVSNASQVKILRDAQVDAIVMVGSYQACAGFVRDVRRAGWGVVIDGVSFVGADQMLKLLADEEKRGGGPIVTNLVNTQVVPYYDDDSVPVVREYRAAMERYDVSLPPGIGDGSYKPASKYSFGSLEGFVSGRALLRVLEKAGRDLTRQSAYAAAEAMGRFDLGLGVDGELSHERHQVIDHVWFTVASPGGWKAATAVGSAIQ
jgi:ABC-type branched-subunit amino acid transport system substrate-binding protein